MVLSLSSCVLNDNSNQVASEAKDQLPQTMKMYARSPESVQIADERVVYKNDSICIIHYIYTANNGFGRPVTNQMQYIYYSRNEKKYEAYSKIDKGDSAYINPQAYEKVKWNTFYENSPYEVGLTYRIILALNDFGHVVGDKNSTVSLPNPFGTGKWHMYVEKDDFGDETGERYLKLVGKGTCTNSASSDIPLTVTYIIDKKEQYMRIYTHYTGFEQKYLWIGTLKIKDSNGNVYDYMRAINHEGGKLTFDTSSKNSSLSASLKKEESISCNIYFHNSPDTYTWRFDFEGYNNAIKYLK